MKGAAQTCATTLLVLLGTIEGCGSSPTSASKAKVCEPDEAISCISSKGCQGYKRCSTDGTTYAACDCTLGFAGSVNAKAGASSSVVPAGGANIVAGFGGNSVQPSTDDNGGASTQTSKAGAGGTTTQASGAEAGAGGTTLQSVAGGGTNSGGTVSSGGSGGALTNVAGSGSVSIVVTGSGGTSPGGRRTKLCDATGQNCKCTNLGSFGAIAKAAYGVGTDGQPSSTTSFETWLAQKSNAAVTFELTYKPWTADYLAGFDVILLQDLRTWDLTESDVLNLSDWVKHGGGLISLNGYMNNDDAEVTATNKVLAFTGMSYLGGAAAGSVPGNSCASNSQKLCPQASSPCCYCWNTALPVTEWTAGHPIMQNVTAVGAFMGRQVNPGDATVVATYDGKAVGAAKGVGLGRAFAWSDEWVTYTGQWAGGQTSGSPDQWNACYNSATSQWLTAGVVLQTMQFWYNAISYVAPPTECDFAISEPEVVILR